MRTHTQKVLKEETKKKSESAEPRESSVPAKQAVALQIPSKYI